MEGVESLFLSAASGRKAKVESVLAGKPGLASARNLEGISLLMWAMYHRQKPIAEFIYQVLDNPDAEEAAAMNDVEMLKQSVKKDPKVVSQYSVDGFTLLHYACFFTSINCVELLLTEKAEIDCPAQNPNQVYPIHSAAAAQSTSIVELLLAAGANPDVQQVGGFTALMKAAAHNNADMINVLLQYGANKCLRDDEGNNAYDHGVANRFEIESLKI